MDAQVRAASPEEIVVENPTNADEKFTDKMNPKRYEALKTYISTTSTKLQRLQDIRGIPALQVALEDLFGVKPVGVALKKFGELLKSNRDSGKVSYFVKRARHH